MQKIEDINDFVMKNIMTGVANNANLFVRGGCSNLTYGLVPIVAGLDKFTHSITDWSQFYSPTIANMIPFSVDTVMYSVGVIEVVE